MTLDEFNPGLCSLSDLTGSGLGEGSQIPRDERCHTWLSDTANQGRRAGCPEPASGHGCRVAGCPEWLWR